MPNYIKLISINSFLVCLAVIAYFYGYISPIFENDVSHITYIISFIIGINIIFEIVNQYFLETRSIVFPSLEKWLSFIEDKFVYLGVAGTLIGFSHMMGAINDKGSIQEAIDAVKVGCLTLGNTTLLGIVGYLWMAGNSYIIGKKESDLFE